MKAMSLILVVLFSLFSVAQATAQDISAGETIYQANCRNCHGPTAKGMASFPKLTGNSADYIVDLLEKYRAGETVGPNTPLMAPLAKDLSDEDIANLAAYITTTFN
ncbi:MAG TPA: c-type cytochrome [Woeseiaceae bacterium]|nr:c-type cytochrome [Woeseiaceae bacterium]